MKIRIVAILIVCLVISSFVSCDSQNETSELTTEDTLPVETLQETEAITTSQAVESMSYLERRETYLDRQKIYKPTEEDLEKIKRKMSLSEVAQYIGKPHACIDSLSSNLVLLWEMADDSVCAIYIRPSDDIEKPTYWDFFEHGVVIYGPKVSMNETFLKCLNNN